jgi:uncharacterized membrane protein
MVNPFDLRTVLLAKHAQHVVLIHFPIALFITGVGFDLLSRGDRTVAFAAAAYLNLCAAAATVIPTGLSGILAWYFVLDGERIKGLLLWHLLAASAATLMVIGTWYAHWSTRRSGVRALPVYRIPLEVLAVATLAVTAHLGGFLSGVNS